MKKFLAFLTVLSMFTLTVGCGGGAKPETPPTADAAADGEHADGHEDAGHSHADAEEGDADATPPADGEPVPPVADAAAPADG